MVSQSFLTHLLASHWWVLWPPSGVHKIQLFIQLNCMVLLWSLILLSLPISQTPQLFLVMHTQRVHGLQTPISISHSSFSRVISGMLWEAWVSISRVLLNKRVKILLIWYAHNFPLHKINIKIKICQTTIFLSWFMSCISFSSIDLSETNCLCKRANNFGGYVLFQERITCENFHFIQWKWNLIFQQYSFYQ